jgi:hypothetical protein
MRGSVIAGALLACSALAAEVSPQDRLLQIAGQISTRYRVGIAVDPELIPMVPPISPGTTAGPEQALDRLCKGLKTAAWRRVYLRQQGPPPSGEVLAAGARALGGIDLTDLAVENADTQRAFLLRSRAGTVSADERRRWEQSPTYVLYSTTAAADGRSTESRMADLQSQQLKLGVREEHQALAQAQMVKLLMDLPPTQREPAFTRFYLPGLQAWTATPPEERRAMMDHTMQVMQRFAAPQPGAGSQPEPTGRKPGELLSRLKAAIAAGAGKHRVVLGPALFPTAEPGKAAAGASPEEALRQITAPLTTVAWRRVYLTPAALETLARPDKQAQLVRAVRLVESVEGNSAFEQPSAGKEWSVERKASSDAADRKQRGLDESPVYVVFSTVPSSVGDTVEQRFADLQRKQMDLLFRLGPDALGRQMDGLVRSYRDADPETRSRMVGLPGMAVMMGIWFPRAAKERQ